MASPTSGPDLHPLASGPASVTPHSAVGPFSQSTFMQMPGRVGAPPPQDGPGGAAPPPSATANGLFGLEAPEISAPPHPQEGGGHALLPGSFSAERILRNGTVPGGLSPPPPHPHKTGQKPEGHPVNAPRDQRPGEGALSREPLEARVLPTLVNGSPPPVVPRNHRIQVQGLHRPPPDAPGWSCAWARPEHRRAPARVCVHGRPAQTLNELGSCVATKGSEGSSCPKHLHRLHPCPGHWTLPSPARLCQPRGLGHHEVSPDPRICVWHERLHCPVPLPERGPGQHRGSKHVSPQP